MNNKTTIKDCKPTVLLNNVLMSGEGVFIKNDERSREYCQKRCCDNLQVCLTVVEKLRQGKSKEAEDLLDY